FAVRPVTRSAFLLKCRSTLIVRPCRCTERANRCENTRTQDDPYSKFDLHDDSSSLNYSWGRRKTLLRYPIQETLVARQENRPASDLLFSSDALNLTNKQIQAEHRRKN